MPYGYGMRRVEAVGARLPLQAPRIVERLEGDRRHGDSACRRLQKLHDRVKVRPQSDWHVAIQYNML
jgi:hypothetical protein